MIRRANIPFPDHARNITGIVHEFRHGGVVLGDGKTASHAVFPEPLRIHAGHQAASARAARGIGDIGIRTLDAVDGQRIQMWCRNIRAAEGPQFTVRQIVYEDDNDVGPPTAAISPICQIRQHCLRTGVNRAVANVPPRATPFTKPRLLILFIFFDPCLTSLLFNDFERTD